MARVAREPMVAARVEVLPEVQLVRRPPPPPPRLRRRGRPDPLGRAEARRREQRRLVPPRHLHRHHRRPHPLPAPRRRVGVPHPHPHRAEQDPELRRRLQRLQPGGDVAGGDRLLPLKRVRQDRARRSDRDVLRVVAGEEDPRPLLRPRHRRVHHLAGDAQLHRTRRRNLPPHHQVAGGGRRELAQRSVEEEARGFPHSVAESGNKSDRRLHFSITSSVTIY